MAIQASNGDVKLHVESSGPANGPLVILVAGLGQQIGDVEFPDDHAECFAQAGFRVARMDNRDAGLSSSFDHVGRPNLDVLFSALFADEPAPVPYSFLDMADDVLRVADAVGEREVHLVGASMGGGVVRWAAVRHPEKVRSLTVVMSGSGADPGDDGPQLAMEGFPELIAMADPRSRDEHIAYTVELWRTDWGTSFPFDEAWVTERVAASFDRSYRPDGLYRQITAAFGAPGLWHAQRAISCPTLVMHGVEDPFFPVVHGEATAVQIPSAELWRVEGMGHAMHPELWVEMVDRIAQLAAR
jgi:pimeloyl-ACP methyl ester carboxylesterase